MTALIISLGITLSIASGIIIVIELIEKKWGIKNEYDWCRKGE